MRVITRHVRESAHGAPIECPDCRRKNGVAIEPGGWQSRICVRCKVEFEFKVVAEQSTAPP